MNNSGEIKTRKNSKKYNPMKNREMKSKTCNVG
jgi:hypothetical protein